MDTLDRGRHDAEVQLRSHLVPAERLLWSGRPPGGILFRPADIFMIPFTLLWGGFAIFREYMVLRDGASWLFALWGIPFVLVGVYILFGRFLVDARQREQTLYGVTNERVIVVSGLWTRKLKSLDLRTLTDVTLSERSDRTGAIAFGAGNPFGWWTQGSPGRACRARLLPPSR